MLLSHQFILDLLILMFDLLLSFLVVDLIHVNDLLSSEHLVLGIPLFPV